MHKASLAVHRLHSAQGLQLLPTERHFPLPGRLLQDRSRPPKLFPLLGGRRIPSATRPGAVTGGAQGATLNFRSASSHSGAQAEIFRGAGLEQYREVPKEHVSAAAAEAGSAAANAAEALQVSAA